MAHMCTLKVQQVEVHSVNPKISEEQIKEKGNKLKNKFTNVHAHFKFL